MSRRSKEAAKKIERERKIRSGGGSSVISIPPEFFEFTRFAEIGEVELEADIGGDEIVIRPKKQNDAEGN